MLDFGLDTLPIGSIIYRSVAVKRKWFFFEGESDTVNSLMEPQGCGATPLSKTQKNALLDDGLCTLIDEIQSLTGATYARLTTAAFLRYAFGSLEPPSDEFESDRSQIWMQLAVGLEKGDAQIEDIPQRLLDEWLTVCSQNLASLHKTIPPGFFIKPDGELDIEQLNLRRTHWTKLRGSVDWHLRKWRDLCTTYGERQALIRVLQAGGFKTPKPTGYGGAPGSVAEFIKEKIERDTRKKLREQQDKE